MAKHAFSLLIKIALFAAMMLIVAKTLHYDDLVNNFISQHMSFDDAESIGRIVLGEPDPEPYDSINFYISILINTLISVPFLSAVISAYHGVTRKISPACLPKEWAFSTFRRFAKIFVFTLLFWALFRFLPYQAVFPDGETYSGFITTAVVAINLLLTIACYWFITNKISSKRSL